MLITIKRGGKNTTFLSSFSSCSASSTLTQALWQFRSIKNKLGTSVVTRSNGCVHVRVYVGNCKSLSCLPAGLSVRKWTMCQVVSISLPDRPFHNFLVSKCVARRSPELHKIRRSCGTEIVKVSVGHTQPQYRFLELPVRLGHDQTFSNIKSPLKFVYRRFYAVQNSWSADFGAQKLSNVRSSGRSIAAVANVNSPCQNRSRCCW